jgi:hypothetical protein
VPTHLLPLIRHSLPVALAVGLGLSPSPARSAVLWQGDFETGDLSQWDGTNLIKTGDRDNLILVGDQVAEGAYAAPADAEIRSNIGYGESLATFRNTMSFFIEPSEGGGTDLVFGTGNLGETERFRRKLALGQWHRIAIHNHWSQDQADGRVNVWYDGEQVVTDAVATKPAYERVQPTTAAPKA